MTAHEHENEGVIGPRCRIRRIPRPRSSELLTPASGIIASILLPMRRKATLISQPTGCSGTPLTGHFSVATMSASCTASSASAKFP